MCKATLKKKLKEEQEQEQELFSDCGASKIIFFHVKVPYILL